MTATSVTSAAASSARPATPTSASISTPAPARASAPSTARFAAMVTAGEYQIAEIVAVWRDEQGRLYVLPPCAHCRELIRQIDDANLDTEVILGDERRHRLRELPPEHGCTERLAPVPCTAGSGTSQM